MEDVANNKKEKNKYDFQPDALGKSIQMVPLFPRHSNDLYGFYFQIARLILGRKTNLWTSWILTFTFSCLIRLMWIHEEMGNGELLFQTRRFLPRLMISLYEMLSPPLYNNLRTPCIRQPASIKGPAAGVQPHTCTSLRCVRSMAAVVTAQQKNNSNSPISHKVSCFELCT